MHFHNPDRFRRHLLWSGVLILTGVGFTNCAPFKTSDVTDVSNSNSGLTSPPLSSDQCLITQLSGATISQGAPLQFQIQNSSAFHHFQFRCNGGDWLVLDSNYLSGDAAQVPTQDSGSFNCVLRGVRNFETSLCMGQLVFSVLGASSGPGIPAPAPAPAPAPVPIPAPSPTSPQNPYPPPPTQSPVGSQNFLSLHQFPVTYNVSSSIDAGGNLIFEKTQPLIGFKNQFSPTGTPGCAMGYTEYRGQCHTVDGGFSFVLKGITSYTTFKVYLPKGLTFFGVSGYLPQSVQYAVAVRMDQPPSRAAPLSSSEYEQAKSAQDRNADFVKLLNGEERLMVHDGGGSISLSGTARLSSAPLTQGRWLYIRVLNGNDIYDLGGIYEVNLDIYKNAYYQIPFLSTGDPQ